MFKKILLISISIIALSTISIAQNSSGGIYSNAASKMLAGDSKLIIGGYGQIDYNQPLSSDKFEAGTLDVHRLVILLGYNFTNKLSFVTELELEHVKEIYVEQAFINYSFNNYLNFRAGLMLVPMGIINEYHEPTTFHGVERPLVDKYISPTTWREIGFGFTGLIPEASLKYQAYVMNGFASYKDDSFLLSGKNGLRKGRQKGAESFVINPNFTAKIEYYGLLGLNIGLSGYFGKTQSDLYNGIEKSNDALVSTADSSVVGVNMIGLDVRYLRKGLQVKGQFYYSALSNTDQYNAFAASNGVTADLGSKMMGYYAEIAYNVFQKSEKIETELYPFIRYSNYDTHFAVGSQLTTNDAFNKNIITGGLSWKINQGVVLKTDMQFIKSADQSDYEKTFNAGIGIWF